MTRRSVARLAACGLGMMFFAGCDSGAKPAAPPTGPNEVNYGPDKIPAADKVARKPGRASSSPGRPPAR